MKTQVRHVENRVFRIPHPQSRKDNGEWPASRAKWRFFCAAAISFAQAVAKLVSQVCFSLHWPQLFEKTRLEMKNQVLHV